MARKEENKKKKVRKNKRLAMEDRVTIEVLVGAGLSFSAIARRIGKDRTTVAKEVRARRYRVGTGRVPCQAPDSGNRPKPNHLSN